VIARGEIAVPGDKSITHRALLLAALAGGRSSFTGALAAGDTRATAACLRALGVDVGRFAEGKPLTVEGRGLQPFRAPRRILDCRNSGTTARLLMGLLAGHPFAATLSGDASLRRRPMERIAAPLRDMGARITTAAGGRLPATVQGGALRQLDYRSPVASAQVKTALLFAGLTGRTRVAVTEPFTSRDHTERLLVMLGVRCAVRGTRVELEPPESLPALEGRIAGDISSAAYLIAAGLLAERGQLSVMGVGVNPTRAGFLRALERMGAKVQRSGDRTELGEPVATLTAGPASLAAVTVEPDEIPSLVDEVPLLACLASRASGTSVFRSVGELRVKESDRLALVAQNLRAVGTDARAEGDTLYVAGGDAPPKGTVITAGDHRLAMAFAVLGTVTGAAVEIDNRDCVAVSYPAFFDDLASVLTDA
jgi:3-phosphoshikimate 1-carboxyvinyltransferase